MFSINIVNIPTISSLAMAIYRSNFMDSDTKIAITDLKTYEKLHSGYTGGACDVYKPESPEGEKVYCYDINSLYPSRLRRVMKHNDFPTGTARHIEGHVDLNDPDTFGFLRVKVTTPKDLYIPLLQVKHEGRTIAPLGTWTDWYFTEELKLASTLGYTFEVLEAVLFERGKVFSKYVSTLYDLRKTYSSEDPRNMICKLLLNSLYGRFGMNPEMTEWTLYNTEGQSRAG